MFSTRTGIESNAKRGFTLVELLIVVAIIAILAAIAIPNFLLAETRSKVASMQAGLATSATAMEAYRTDYDNYPLYDVMTSTSDDHSLSYFLTTPVAYMSTLAVDLYEKAITTPNSQGKQKYLRYNCETYTPGSVFSKLTAQGWSQGEASNEVWVLWSKGPAQKDSDGLMLYDPTNGTVSNGNLVRFGP